jgi:hypothetical protein
MHRALTREAEMPAEFAVGRAVDLHAVEIVRMGRRAVRIGTMDCNGSRADG